MDNTVCLATTVEGFFLCPCSYCMAAKERMKEERLLEIKRKEILLAQEQEDLKRWKQWSNQVHEVNEWRYV